MSKRKGVRLIYDATLPQHMDAVFIANSWKSIAKELNIPVVQGDDVKTRWRILRDTYVKKKKEIVKKKKSGSGASAPVCWNYMDILSFLEPFMQQARTESNMMEEAAEKSSADEDDTANQHAEITQEGDRNSELEDDINPCPSPPTSYSSGFTSRTKTHETTAVTSIVSSHTSQKYRKKKNNNMSEFETTFLDLAKSQSSRLDSSTRMKRKTAMDDFFESCALRANELPN